MKEKFFELLKNFYWRNFLIIPLVIGFVGVILSNQTFNDKAFQIFTGQFYFAGLIFYGMLWFFWIVVKACLGILHDKPEEKHVRGAMMTDHASIAKYNRKEPCDLMLGSIPLPVSIETRGIVLVGTPGAGKSVAETQLLAGARQRKSRAVIFDVGGQFVEKFYRPDKDFILNPMDSRSVNWSIFAEITNPKIDCIRLAKSIVPDRSDDEWNGYAQQAFAGILNSQFQMGERTNGDFIRRLAVSSISDLRGILEGTPAARLLSPDVKGMAGSVLGVLGAYASSFALLDKNADDKSFSIKKWTETTEADSWLFLSVRDDQAALLNPLVSIWIDCVASALLSLDEDLNRRLIFGLDEMDSLPRIQNIIALVSKGRKKGGFPIVAIQTVSQLESKYGRDDAQTILSCLGTLCAFRTPDFQTADYLSRYFGEGENLKIRESRGTRDDEKNWSEHVETARILLPSQFQKIPDLKAYTKLAGDLPPSDNYWKYVDHPKIAKTFEDA